MARTSGSNNFAGTLEILAASALDARDIVSTKADLTASGSFPYPYIGMETYVVAENKKYRLIADDPTVLANWEEVGSGGTGLPSGGTQGQVLTKQSATDGDANWDDIPHDNTKANSSSLAPVETSTTSEHAYTVGDHLMLAGGRFLVTADIAIGDTLDVSTNIQAISIEDETGLSQADFADIITPLPGQPTEGIIISPEERRIGWYYNMDGSGTKKPLYQKRVHFNSITMPADNQYSDTPISSDATLELVDAYGTFLANGATNTIPLNELNRNNGLGQYSVRVRSIVSSGITSLSIIAYSTSSWLSSITDVNITIQYTKTTDTYA